MPDRQDFDPGIAGPEPIERDVPGAAGGNHEFADVAPHRAADQRVILQDPRRVDDGVRRAVGGAGIVFRKEVEKAIEIAKRAR